MKHIKITTCLITACFAIALTPSNLSAGQIGIENFTAAAVVQDFENLEVGIAGSVDTPLMIDENNYDANGHRLTFSSKLGPAIGRSGVALRNSHSSNSPTFGFIDITLGSPARRVGLYVGDEFPWEYGVEFYGKNKALLGTLSFSGTGRDNSFAAWQTNTVEIGRIRVVNAIRSSSLIIIDDLIQEVPEPTAAVLLLLGAITSIGLRR